MLPSLLLIGVAFSLAYGPLTIAATEGVDESEQGLAGGLLNASVQFGAALVLAVVTAVNVTVTGDSPTPDDLLDGYRTALLVPIAGVALAAVITGSRTPTAPAAAAARLLTGQLSHDRGERVGAGGAEDEVGEADLLPSPLDLLGGRRGVIRKYCQRVHRAKRCRVGVGRRHERRDGVADHRHVLREFDVAARAEVAYHPS